MRRLRILAAGVAALLSPRLLAAQAPPSNPEPAAAYSSREDRAATASATVGPFSLDASNSIASPTAMWPSSTTDR